MTTEVKIDNNLFNDKKMEEFIELYDDSLTINADCDPISYWIKKLDNDELKSEKTNYIRFFKIILENILGYEFTDIQYEESIGDEGRPVEFTLKKGDKDYVVVELKGTTCKDLNKRYNREQSPIEQVTNYASIKEETQWAFVSNYDEFRFFNPSYREKYISFKFKQLTDPNVLKRFLLIFSKFSLIDKDIPQTLLKETRIIERELEDEFYKLFSETRLMIIEELKNYSGYTNLEAIRLAQLILNRFIFLCFAEDLKLIPSETTADVLLTPIKHKNLFEFTMWDRINELFRFADKGNIERGIGAFNGGLFKENLRHIEIRDKVEDDLFFEDCHILKPEVKYKDINPLIGVYKDTLNPIYKNLLLISSYDFGSELSVNILGHIFENSIGDIEELKNETTERRKKEGVFYTPEYITDYICRNTIIPYLSINGESNTVHKLISEYEKENKLEELDFKLKQIRILDPACGSGAFLNKSVDILFEIHKALYDSIYSDEQLDKYVFDSLDSRREIISNNIYGVDLNEESTEITKLSLFLKLATTTGVKQGFKLPNLDNNIKCGNSLIDDEKVDKKAFKWEEEFEDILNGGGFDIVVGNPPYVRQELINPLEKDFLNENFETCTKSTDLYVGFFERSMNMMKENGYFSFICSNKFISVDYGKNLRKFLLKYNIKKYNDYSDDKIFSDAEVSPCIIIIQKTKENKNKIIVNETDTIPQELLNENVWFFSDIQSVLLKDKLIKKGIPLKDIKSIEINNGIKTGFNDAFYINETLRMELISKDINNSKVIKPLLVGKDIGAYNIYFKEQYLIFTRQGIEIDNFPVIKKYLEQFKEDLTPKINRSDKKGRKPGDYKWFEIQDKTDFYENFEKEKLIWAEMNHDISFCYDTKGYYVNNKCFIITSDEVDLKFLNGLFLSKLFNFIFKSMSSSLGSETVEMRKSYVKNAPIIISEEYSSKISDEVTTMLNYNEQYINEIMSFHKWLKRTFNLNKLSKKLESYYELDFDSFIEELKKKKVDINSRENQQLLETEFKNSLKLIQNLKISIDEIHNNINKLSYELYELSEKEIAIIENSFIK
ncbi:Eco57I restriction-modification methylase domain-containing protein [uncultured Methanobrevibacter sp.]|uniref:Eco57I restriction-modification methylase domain-containing protein n=1 Tax=uncultured Methanobrevibacter sp. TaxID=253161 RepID=UPI0025E7378B|nr:DNA methyltransferase [uncultured Methanobrevibacter sp.]